MQYYSIVPQAKLPRNMSGTFTYFSDEKLSFGDVVEVEFRQNSVLGVCIDKARNAMPDFQKTLKPVIKKVCCVPRHIVRSLIAASEHYLFSPALLWKFISPQMPKRIVMTHRRLQEISLGKYYSYLSVPRGYLETIQKIVASPDSYIFTSGFSYLHQYVVYVKLIERHLEKGSVLFLVPTRDDLKTALSFFPSQWNKKTCVLESHSHTSKSATFLQWKQLCETQKPMLAVGMRSAVFAPLHNLSLIVLHDAHSDDYKQYDQNPRYDARWIAREISRSTGCFLKIFGYVSPQMLEEYTSDESFSIEDIQ